MRHNLNYIYIVLISYPGATVLIFILLFIGNFYEMAFWEDLGIMKTLSAVIATVFKAMAVKVVSVAILWGRKFDDLNPMPVKYVVLMVLVLLVISFLFELPIRMST